MHVVIIGVKVSQKPRSGKMNRVALEQLYHQEIKFQMKSKNLQVCMYACIPNAVHKKIFTDSTKQMNISIFPAVAEKKKEYYGYITWILKLLEYFTFKFP